MASSRVETLPKNLIASLPGRISRVAVPEACSPVRPCTRSSGVVGMGWPEGGATQRNVVVMEIRVRLILLLITPTLYSHLWITTITSKF